MKPSLPLLALTLTLLNSCATRQKTEYDLHRERAMELHKLYHQYITMPNFTQDDAYREALASAPPGHVAVETLEIRHPDAPAIFMCQQRQGITAFLETGEEQYFDPVPFSLKKPEMGRAGIAELPVTVDNLDGKPGDYIKSIKGSPIKAQIIWRPYTLNDLSRPRISPVLRMTFKDVVITAAEVKGRGAFADIVNKPFPDDYYLRSRFPTLGNGNAAT